MFFVCAARCEQMNEAFVYPICKRTATSKRERERERGRERERERERERQRERESESERERERDLQADSNGTLITSKPSKASANALYLHLAKNRLYFGRHVHEEHDANELPNLRDYYLKILIP
jgi:hypothetical protein